MPLFSFPSNGAEQMFYIWTLDAHELHGPFTTERAAHNYAYLYAHTSYQIKSDRRCQQEHINTEIRLVPARYRDTRSI
jgi:hypothetical protein